MFLIRRFFIFQSDKEDNSKDFGSRIYHGRPALEEDGRLEERQFQLWVIINSLKGDEEPRGGAVLINSDWALTAAHVVTDDKDHLCSTVVVGGGSKYWDEKMSKYIQKREFICRKNVIVHWKYKASACGDAYGISTMIFRYLSCNIFVVKFITVVHFMTTLLGKYFSNHASICETYIPFRYSPN